MFLFGVVPINSPCVVFDLAFYIVVSDLLFLHLINGPFPSVRQSFPLSVFAVRPSNFHFTCIVSFLNLVNSILANLAELRKNREFGRVLIQFESVFKGKLN